MKSNMSLIRGITLATGSVVSLAGSKTKVSRDTHSRRSLYIPLGS